jgi:hypothetical protein
MPHVIIRSVPSGDAIADSRGSYLLGSVVRLFPDQAGILGGQFHEALHGSRVGRGGCQGRGAGVLSHHACCKVRVELSRFRVRLGYHLAVSLADVGLLGRT